MKRIPLRRKYRPIDGRLLNCTISFEIAEYFLFASDVEFKQPKNFVAVPFKYHERVELTIDDITNLGMGLGRIDDWVVMVPYVFLGEVAIVRIHKNLKNYSIGDLIEVVKPSPDRIEPKCSLFGICGGCQYQHIRYEKQLDLKRHHVSTAMKKLAGITFPVNECLHGDRPYNYRSKITPHFQKSVPPIGFLKEGMRTIVDVEQCPIATESINNSLGAARENILRNKSSLKRGGTLLLRDLGQRVETNPKVVVSQKIGNFNFSYRAGEFFQNNPYALPRLTNFVVQAALGPKYLIDAYCGVGVFGIMAAKNFEKVLGIEVSETAINFARQNARANEIDNIRFIVGVAEQIFENAEFAGSETSIIIDPPRAGCAETFLSQLIAFCPAKIVYVSCAPDTQARDLKFLAQQYSIEEIQPIDMFPQTRHMENIVVLKWKS
ncbi:MAG: class I SAM-dependent RNA methyltransferase [Puniceicoccales bacterium]|jgi:23S rRNA (uracil1939-C5)-methyltransferase/tRNA (uracil-5-)-methyltransferase|nr:class I SAM-dependent RNA methyltransferase [Puniceicoccales bacterium]